MTPEQRAMIEAEAAKYAKEVWNFQEPAEDVIQTRKGKRSYEDYIAGRSKGIERIEELEKEVAFLRRLSGRKPDTKYTYYKLELKNMSEEWNETICESLDDVRKQLEYLDIHLDDDSETEPGEERRVIITGVGMTPLEYESWYRDACRLDD